VKTQYQLRVRRDLGLPYAEVGSYSSLAEATAAYSRAPAGVWDTNGEGTYWPRNHGADLVYVSTEQVPETTEDRVQLAQELILDCGQIDGEHHKQWVLDQVLRLLAGDAYGEAIDQYRVGEDGPSTYEWDEGIAP
jgi:hypothetical protein